MIEHLHSVDSTNSELRRRIIDGTAHILSGTPDILVADVQTEGRGKDTAAWFSKPDKCLTMSISFTLPATNYWREHIGDTMMVGAKAAIETLIPLLSGGVARQRRGGLKECGLRRGGLESPITPKAPNDLYVGDKKIAGLLGELVLESDDLLYCVLGIGLNITLTESEAPFPNASSLLECGLIDATQAEVIREQFPETFTRTFCTHMIRVL